MTTAYKYNGTEMAKYIIGYANDKGYFMNMTKLQKLLYISYGIYLAVKKERLIDDTPEAWPYGPVFPIVRKAMLFENFSKISINDVSDKNIKEDEEIKSLLDLVFRKYGNKTAGWLSAWSHQEGSPWDITVCNSNWIWGKTIPDDLIYNFFNGIITRNAKS